MGECLGIHVSRRRTLQPIVTHGRRGVEPFLDVALIEQSSLLGGVAPNAGEAIGLQLESYRDRVCRTRIITLEPARLRIDTQEMLDVMAKFVSEHVSLSE